MLRVEGERGEIDDRALAPWSIGDVRGCSGSLVVVSAGSNPAEERGVGFLRFDGGGAVVESGLLSDARPLVHAL